MPILGRKHELEQLEERLESRVQEMLEQARAVLSEQIASVERSLDALREESAAIRADQEVEAVAAERVRTGATDEAEDARAALTDLNIHTG